MDKSNFSKNCSPKVTNHLSMVFFLLTKSNLKVLDEEYDYSSYEYEQVDPFLDVGVGLVLIYGRSC